MIGHHTGLRGVAGDRPRRLSSSFIGRGNLRGVAEGEGAREGRGCQFQRGEARRGGGRRGVFESSEISVKESDDCKPGDSSRAWGREEAEKSKQDRGNLRGRCRRGGRGKVGAVNFNAEARSGGGRRGVFESSEISVKESDDRKPGDSSRAWGREEAEKSKQDYRDSVLKIEGLQASFRRARGLAHNRFGAQSNLAGGSACPTKRQRGTDAFVCQPGNLGDYSQLA
jgi:hypothetical protein